MSSASCKVMAQSSLEVAGFVADELYSYTSSHFGTSPVFGNFSHAHCSDVRSYPFPLRMIDDRVPKTNCTSSS